MKMLDCPDKSRTVDKYGRISKPVEVSQKNGAPPSDRKLKKMNRNHNIICTESHSNIFSNIYGANY